jgi:hypothetical protein
MTWGEFRKSFSKSPLVGFDSMRSSNGLVIDLSIMDI